ncbi:MAG: AI-2E family transporter [Campylobacterota bacterium]|nr:AI-2E family transporter [Campylobacterota bacterium]
MKQKYFVVILFLLSLLGVFLLYKPFLMSIVIASLLAISTASINNYFIKKTSSILWSAIISTLLLAIIFFAPLSYFLTTFTIKINSINIEELQTIYNNTKAYLLELNTHLGFAKIHVEDFINNLDTKDITKNSLHIATLIGGYSASFIKSGLLILVFYFFAIYNSKPLIDFLKSIVHIGDKDAISLGSGLSSTMSVVFYSIIATAILEGALFGGAVAFMGYDGLLFGILYGFSSLVPVIGGAILWVPFTLYELSLGNTSWALFISIYSIVVISIIADTFIKPVIIKIINSHLSKGMTPMNEVVIFFSIIAGLTTFGFWGMILGPAITAFFLSTLKLFEKLD